MTALVIGYVLLSVVFALVAARIAMRLAAWVMHRNDGPSKRFGVDPNYPYEFFCGCGFHYWAAANDTRCPECGHRMIAELRPDGSTEIVYG